MRLMLPHSRARKGSKEVVCCSPIHQAARSRIICKATTSKMHWWRSIDEETNYTTRRLMCNSSRSQEQPNERRLNETKSALPFMCGAFVLASEPVPKKNRIVRFYQASGATKSAVCKGRFIFIRGSIIGYLGERERKRCCVCVHLSKVTKTKLEVHVLNAVCHAHAGNCDRVEQESIIIIIIIMKSNAYLNRPK